MAWNEPGNRGESPWGKKRPAGKSGGFEESLKNWQQRLQAALGGRPPEPPAGGEGGAGSGELPAGFVWKVVIGVLLVWLASGLFQINASDRGVIQRFGKFTEVRGEGISWAFPWPIERVTKVNVSQVNSVAYRSRVLTADVNLVEIGATVQYQNADPVKVLFQVKDLASTLPEVSESALREVMGQATLDDVLGAARQQITDNARVLIQRTMDGYNSGVRITSVNLTDVQVPDAVIAAQRDANKAIEDRERYSMEAQAYANDILPNAVGTAQRHLQDAEAYKAQVVSLAEGDAARFNSVYAAYAQAPDVTRQRMYIETVEQVMQQANKVVLDTKDGAGGNMIYLPLDRLMERSGGAAGARGAATGAAGTVVLDELPTVNIDGRARGVR